MLNLKLFLLLDACVNLFSFIYSSSPSVFIACSMFGSFSAFMGGWASGWSGSLSIFCRASFSGAMSFGVIFSMVLVKSSSSFWVMRLWSCRTGSSATLVSPPFLAGLCFGRSILYSFWMFP